MRPRAQLGDRTPPVEVVWPVSQVARTPEERALSDKELARLDGVLRRLHAELRSLLASMPGAPLGASELARDLGIDRSICQRVVSAASGPFAGREMVAKLPGVKGLMVFLESARGAGADAAAADSADAAAAAFASAVQDLGPSQSKLIRRIEQSDGGGEPANPLEVEEREESVRRRMFECDCQLTGQYTEVSVATFFFRPTPGTPNRIDMGLLRGFLGHRMRPDAMPFSLLWWVAPPDKQDPQDKSGYETLDHAPVQGRSQGVLLEEYSSKPFPVVTSQGPRERRVVMIDPASLPEGEGFDVVTANRVDGAQLHPTFDSPPVHEVWMLGRLPAKLLIFDVFLHRSMARACIPSIGAYMMSPNLAETMDRRWLDRFPVAPRLALLDPGNRTIEHPAYPRYGELVGHMFKRLDWAAGEYVGYRCEVLFPQWGAGYCMLFDYSPADGESPRRQST